ncbi:MAG: 4Fe-4S binding protein [Candidatus Bathyarchaeia archaeon]
MVLRKIIRIDESKCDGCAQCIPACPEAAIQIINGKACLVDERYCDGLGACIGNCPKGAIAIEEREATEFDEEAVRSHIEGLSLDKDSISSSMVSALSQWPIKLELINPQAPFFQGASLLVAADCVPFVYAKFHEKFLKGRKLVFGCPKFGNAKLYLERLSELLSNFEIKDITVVHMEVPCCSGLGYIVEKALKLSDKKILTKRIVVGV